MFWVIAGAIGSIVSTLVVMAVFCIAYARLVDHATAWVRARRAARLGPEMASAQERSAAQHLGYLRGDRP